MVQGWYENQGKWVEDKQYLMSYEAYCKVNKRFRAIDVKNALSIHFNTWGVRLLKEVMEMAEGEPETACMHFEDEMVKIKVQVSSARYLKSLAAQTREAVLT